MTLRIPRRRKREPMGVRTEGGPIRCPGHLSWVRGHVCVACDLYLLGIEGTIGCLGRTEAHHVREGHGAMGTKPGDDNVVPICAAHHRQGHSVGWKTFEARYRRIDLDKIAAALWKNSPARIRWERRRGEK